MGGRCGGGTLFFTRAFVGCSCCHKKDRRISITITGVGVGGHRSECNSLYDGNLMSRPSASQRFLSVGSYRRCTVLCTSTARLTVTMYSSTQHMIAMNDALTVEIQYSTTTERLCYHCTVGIIIRFTSTTGIDTQSPLLLYLPGLKKGINT
jgi:hypothetical protein